MDPRAHRPTRRRRTPRGVAVGALAAAVLSLYTIAFLAFGGVHPSTRAVLHSVVFAALICAATIRAPLLARVGTLQPYAQAFAVLWGVAALALVPVPSGWLGVLSPGALHARGSLTTLSASVPHTIDGLTHGLLAIGAGLTVGLLAVVVVRRAWLERALVGVALILVPLAAVHAYGRVDALFGVVPTWIRPPYRFFAPFLNPNHLASALLLPLPLLVGVATGHLQWRAEARWGAACLAIGSGALVAGSGSWGAAAAAGLQLLAIATLWGRMPRWGWGVGALVAMVGFVVLDQGADPGRLPMWRVAMRAFAGHWAFGSGVGTFDLAAAPLRGDQTFVQWVHAHNDLVEWLTTTGVVGAMGLAIAARTLWPALRTAPERARWLLLGAAGVAVHALVDFPLQIPALAMALTAALAVGTGAYRDGPRVPVHRVRGALVGLAVLQAVAATWQLRGAWAEAALDRGDVATLGRLAPWHPEVGLAAAAATADRGDRAGAIQEALAVARRHPADPAAQRAVAVALARVGALSEADAVIERAIRLAPHDWRAYAVRATLWEQLQPERAGDAWLEVVARAGSTKMLRKGWQTLPVGLPWVDAARNQPAWYQRQVARTVAALGDPDAALIGFEQAQASGPGQVDLVHVRLLSAAGRHLEALSLVDQLLRRSPAHRHALRVRAEIHEQAGDGERAVQSWARLAEVEPAAQGDAVRSAAEEGGARAGLALIEQLEGRHGATGVHTSARIEQAKILHAQGDGRGCVRVLERSGALDHRVMGPRAKALALLCDRSR